MSTTTLFGNEFHQNPYPIYAWLRENRPVYAVTLPNGTSGWLVTRYDDARAVLVNPALSKNQHRYLPDADEGTEAGWLAQLPEVREVLSGHMINSDPPDHIRLRRLVTKVFTPRRVRALRPRVQEITDNLLDGLGRRQDRQADLVEELAFPLPMTVMCELLGIPEVDQNKFKSWGSAITAGFGSGGHEFVTATMELKEYAHQLLAVKRAAPGEDVLSGLIAVRDGNDRLTENELVSMVFLLLMTGLETSAHLIGTGTYLLLSHPSQRVLVETDRTLMPAAVEEVLRFDGPVKTMSLRFATMPITLRGVSIPEGGILIVAPQAANRDPNQFIEPDKFDITRGNDEHLAFGYGPHFCVAAALGRLEATVAIGELLGRFPALATAVESEQLNWVPGILVRGLTKLPVRY